MVSASVTPAVKAFVVVFLTVVIACGLLGVEAWPLTGWRLFSRLRSEYQVGWQAVTVDAAGRETPVPFGELPRGYHGALHLMQAFPTSSSARRRDVCEAWADAVRRRGSPVDAVRVYRTVRHVPTGRAAGRDLRFTCAET